MTRIMLALVMASGLAFSAAAAEKRNQTPMPRQQVAANCVSCSTNCGICGARNLPLCWKKCDASGNGQVQAGVGCGARYKAC